MSEPDASELSQRRFLLAHTLRATAGKLVMAAYRLRIVGRAHVPAGRAILAGNHVSYLDPVLLWCCAPRPVHFMAKSELFDQSLLGWLLPRLWAFPVRRGEADRQAISTASDLLAAEELVGVFPEGTRHRTGEDELGEAQSGAAFLALRTGSPIVPVGIAGTDKALPVGAKLPRFPHVTIRYGEPIDPSAFAEGGRKERVAAITSALMDGIATELERARKG